MTPGPRLRPMDLRDLLDETFDLYKSNFVLFFSVMAVTLPAFALLFVLVSIDAFGDAPVDLAVMMGLLGPVLFVLTGLAALFAAGALTHAVSERYRGHAVTVIGAYRAAFRHPFRLLYTLIVATFLLGLCEFGGMIIPLAFLGGLAQGAGSASESLPFVFIIFALLLLLPVVALWMAFHFVLAVPAYFLEDLSGYAAVKRSFELFFHNSRKSALGMFLITGISIFMLLIMTAVLLAPAVFLLTPLEDWGRNVLAASLEGALFGIILAMALPLILIFTVLLYYDHCIRKEGFDLKVMAEELQEWQALDASRPPTESNDTLKTAEEIASGPEQVRHEF